MRMQDPKNFDTREMRQEGIELIFPKRNKRLYIFIIRLSYSNLGRSEHKGRLIALSHPKFRGPFFILISLFAIFFICMRIQGIHEVIYHHCIIIKDILFLLLLLISSFIVQFPGLKLEYIFSIQILNFWYFRVLFVCLFVLFCF